jgi:hypothetical protein
MKMGYEGLIYYGVKGSTAATLISNRVDIGFDVDPQMAPTTVAGAGTAPPIETEGVATLKWSCTVKMKNVAADAVLAALRTAAAAGNAVAIRMKDYASGKGYDGDCNVKETYGGNLNGEQTFDFTLTPNGMLRTPQLYV